MKRVYRRKKEVNDRHKRREHEIMTHVHVTLKTSIQKCRSKSDLQSSVNQSYNQNLKHNVLNLVCFKNTMKLCKPVRECLAFESFLYFDFQLV